MTISSAQQPRQEYGFGSFVKKITRPIKKIAKSPLGKAALIGGGLYGLGGAGFWVVKDIQRRPRFISFWKLAKMFGRKEALLGSPL